MKNSTQEVKNGSIAKILLMKFPDQVKNESQVIQEENCAELIRSTDLQAYENPYLDENQLQSVEEAAQDDESVFKNIQKKGSLLMVPLSIDNWRAEPMMLL